MQKRIHSFINGHVRTLLSQAVKSLESRGSVILNFQILMIASLATNWLMWAYSIVADIYTEEPLVSDLSYALSLAHLVAPFLLFLTARFVFVASLLLGLCILQQLVLSYFFGGLNGNIIVWYGVVPILGGVLHGFRGVLAWSLLVFASTGVFICLQYQGYAFPHLLMNEGNLYAPLLTAFGWGVCLTAIISVFIWRQEEKEELLREKSGKINNLLRILTHDVSNSLNVINTASTLFQNYDQDLNRVKYYFEKMDLAASNINEVISSVRTLHSAENDWEPIKLIPSRLRDSVDYCSELLEDSLRSKNLTLNIDFDSFDDTDVMVDPLFFNNHVLMNVLSNAVKFSNFGSTIDVYGKSVGKKSGLVVQDRGVGMTKETLQHLFREKYNKSLPGTAGEKGTGFGMLILKSFMDRFEGNVWVESDAHGKDTQGGTKVTLLFKRSDSAVDLEGNDLGLRHLVVKSVQPEQSNHVACAEEYGGNKLSNNFS